ncbi:MAG: heavy metal-binding domain-containing protein [Mangrovibacterium sp.]
MNNKIFATTTDSIENAEIEAYFDLVSTNVVIGTNIFSDLGAALSDLFGGYSKSYQNKLHQIYQVAIDNLKFQAANMGANGIVGLKIDFDEISGGNKSMFMISGLGTAVKLRFLNEQKRTDENDISYIPSERLEIEVTKRKIIANLQNNKLPSAEDWIFLFNNPIEEIVQKLLAIYLNQLTRDSFDQQNERELLESNMPNFLRIINPDFTIPLLYGHMKPNNDHVFKIISQNKLFSPAQTIGLIKKGEVSLAIKCLSADKEYYSKEDLRSMQEIVDLLDNLPDKGRIETVKGIIGKAKEKYICPGGHSNDADVKYCSLEFCKQNIKGLTRKQTADIEDFRIKIYLLLSLFKDIQARN